MISIAFTTITRSLFLLVFIDIPYIDQNSYSNSNNGGSVNSQDSLWKAPQLVPNEQMNMQNQHNHVHNYRNSGNYEQHHHQSYTPADDYVPYENRNNYVTDAYGPVPKPKRRLDLIGESITMDLNTTK